MARRVIISHGTLGHPGRAWFPWLAAQLQELGIEVVLPHYPTPEEQSLESWLAAFREAAAELRSDDILVGHSLGAVFSLRLLEHYRLPIKGTFLVAAFAGPIGNLRFDALNTTFVEAPFDWAAIRDCAGVLKSYSSDNDPFVPLSLGLELAAYLNIKAEIIPNGGHLIANSGYAEFPLLLNEIVPLIGAPCSPSISTS